MTKNVKSWRKPEKSGKRWDAAVMKKHRDFKLPVAEIIKVADALFQGREGGWVSISVNAYGRQCVEKVFKGQIAN